MSVYTCDKKQMSLYFLFTAAVSMYTARQVNKKYGDVCLLQQEGSNQRNLLFEMKTQEEHIPANIFKKIC